MARIIDEKREGASGNRKATINQNGRVTQIDKDFTIVYMVVGEVTDTPAVILGLTGIPQVGDIREGLVCQRVTTAKKSQVVENGQLKSLWTVSAEYSNELEETEPTELPPEIRWTSEQYEEVLRQDAIDNNKKVVTACGEPLLLTAKKVIPVLTIKRTQNAPFSPLVILQYTNTVNSSAFWGAGANTALMASIEAVYKQVDTLNAGKKWFVDVTYVIKFKFDPNFQEPWKARILHAGTKYFPKAGAEAQKWMDVAGNTGVINLDANGLKLADNAAPIYLDFNVYRKADWSSLNLNPAQLGNYFTV